MNLNNIPALALGVLTLLISSPTFAQTNKKLSIEEAITLGVQNSKMLKGSVAKIASANASLQQVKSRRLPTASISGSYLRVAKPTTSIMFGQSNKDPNATPTTTPSVSQAMYALGNVSYTLFDGFSTSSAIAATKYINEAIRLDAETDKQATILNIVAAYSNLYKATSSALLMQENLNQSKQRTKDFENLEKNGIIARNDLLKVKLQESNIQLALLDAESDARVANLNMGLLLGLPETIEIIVDTNYFQKTNDPQNLTYWEQQAMAQRSDLQSIALRSKAAEANIRSAKGAYYPSLSLTGGYIALNVPNFLTVTDAWNAGVGVRYNIASLWKASADVKAAKAQFQEATAALEQIQDNAKIQLYKAYEDYLVSVKKIDVLEVALEQANENFKIVKNKHSNSLATTTDLLDADVAQLQAKLNYSYAKADAAVAYNNLLKTSGQLVK